MKKILLLGAALPVLFLAGCGEGWDMYPYADTPYQTRTAGYGVEYVRANMMPEKGPVVEPIMAPAPDPEPEPVPVAEPEPEKTEGLLESGEKFFRDIMRK